MRNPSFKLINFLILLAGLVVWSNSFAEDIPDKTKPRARAISKTAGNPAWTILNINNFVNWVRRDAPGALSPHGDNQAVYPRGTGNAIYTDGFYFGGKAFTNAAKTTQAPRQTVRVGGKGYSYGLSAGWVTGSGVGATAIAPTHADARSYRIRRDYLAMTDQELRRDAAEINEIPVTSVTDAQVAAVVAQYALDWTNWPVSLGSPFVDRNGDGIYTAPPAFGPTFTVDSLIAQNRDEPGVAGSDPNSPADQVIWTVCNDLNPSVSIALHGSEPLGLEFQFTVWGYKRTDALGQLFFKRIKIINKGGVDTSHTTTAVNGSFWIDSMFVCLWSDVDLGSFTDDLAGCDSTLSMGFVYNGNAIDETYNNFGYPPPAVGYDFLAGPIEAAVGDSAVFDLKKRYGVRNLPMSSFAYFSAGSPYSDPCNNSTGGAYICRTFQWWKMLRGFAPIGNQNTADVPYNSGPYISPRFPLSGDPVKQTGFVDGLGTNYSFVPGDRRILLNTGPFTMAPGDTQEVVVGVVAGLGSDRLSSVAVMKFNDRFVQNTYNALFSVPAPPLAPDMKFAELDGEIALEWGSNLTRVNDIENRVSNPGAYVFEGYNIYQLPSRGARLSDSKRVVTFDKPTDPTVVLDEQFDQSSGQILFIPVQFGTNNGVQRYFRFNRDYIKDFDKIYNGQEYYLAVTAYAVSTVTGYLPSQLESSPIVFTVRPKIPFGAVPAVGTGDTLSITHSGTGNTDGTIRPIVVNPGAATGNTYQVTFDTTGSAAAGALTTTWMLRNVTKNTTLLSGETNQSGDANYKIVEGGVYLKVEGPAPGLNPGAWSWGPSAGARFMTWVGGDFGWEDFNGAAGYGSPRNVFGDGTLFVGADQLKAITIRFKSTSDNIGTFNNSTDDTGSYAYRYGRGFAGAAAQPSFAPWIINTAGGYSYQDYRISAPLSVYDVDANPPRRLAFGYLENNASGGTVNGFYWPPDLNGDNIGGSGPREWLWISNSTYTGSTADAVFQAEAIGGDMPFMYWLSWTRRNTRPWPGAPNYINFTPTRINTPNDVFTYVIPKPASGPDQDIASAGLVNVFPNPYYAFNAAETNRFSRFVTFSNLPPTATIRIFNLAGQLVRVLTKDPVSNPGQFVRWDLLNRFNFPVASGMYIAHVEMTLPSDGSTVTKVLKLAVIQEQEILDSY
ncbi:MAG: T9SS type A sorting domain-containing protein [Ignavibacteriales bacterium]|nr:T9SS type A sorting domain-containing protein [Ignavibacteriales bacterium]